MVLPGAGSALRGAGRLLCVTKEGDVDFRTPCIAVGVALAISAAWAGPRPVLQLPSLENIPLLFVAPKALARADLDKPGPSTGNPVYVGRFLDSREDPSLVGVCVRDDTVRNVTTRDTVATWMRLVAVKLLRYYGVNVVDDSLTSAVSIGVTVNEAFVREKTEYSGSVNLTVALRKSDGAALFTKKLSAVATRRGGRKYYAPFYYECLSETMVTVLETLTEDADFVAAAGLSAARSEK